nr:integrase, catalytic region, zinc finger, CCHC-type, peptidase aspartic, catalytic [Tanacetum cinerariifolium]
MAQLTEHHKSNCATMHVVKSKVLAPGWYAIDIEPIPPRIRNNKEVHLDYLKHLKESVETLREIVEEAKVERPLDRSLASACLYTKHSQKLLEYVTGTCPKDFNQRDKKHVATPVTRKKQVTFVDPCETSTNNTLVHVKQQTMHQTNDPAILSTGVNDATAASGSKPRSNTKKDMTLPAKSDMQKVEVHPRNNKSSVKQNNHVDSSISYKRNVVHIVLWYLDSGYSKHMTGDHSRLRNFMKKFIGTVRFGNDHFGVIMGYEDYMIGDSVISRVYYVEGLGHNLFSIKQLCDSDLEVASRKHSCYVRDTNGVELIKGSRGLNLYTISVEDLMKSSPICLLSGPQQKLEIQCTKLSIFVWFQMQVVQIVLWYLDSGCSKHMTGDHSWLRNFLKKFIGTVRFGNDHFGAIMGYEDYMIGDSVISRVKDKQEKDKTGQKREAWKSPTISKANH